MKNVDDLQAESELIHSGRQFVENINCGNQI